MIPNHMSSSFQEKTVASARYFDVYQGMEQRSFAVNTFSKTYVSWVKSKKPREIALLISRADLGMRGIFISCSSYLPSGNLT